MKKRIFSFFDDPVPVPDAVADGGAGGEQLGELDDI